MNDIKSLTERAYECFKVEIKDNIANIILSRPDKANSMIRSFWGELPQIVRAIDDNALARVIVLTAEGKHFSSGMDLSVFSTGPDLSAHEIGSVRANIMETLSVLQQAFTCLEAARMPVLMAAHGACMGATVDFASACDMRYCTSDAYFSIHEINIGMVADLGTFPRLPYLIPHGLARELAYTGRRMLGEEAKSSGFVNQVFETVEELHRAVFAIAREIANRSPLAVWGSKEMLNYGRDHSVVDSLRHMTLWQAGMFQDPDMIESFKALNEKRPGQFENLLPKISAL